MVAFEKAPPDARQLLPVRIRELGLKLEGTPLAGQIEELYRELDEHGLHHFRPRCYLSDEWGCPSGEPVIGIPFYLADPRVAEIENAMNDVENETEVMMYLRHEAGHAFNYAYELYRTREWSDVFGPFRRPYRDDFAFAPFSREYVRHIAGWYAQKHPDEDFAETFAVWLDPTSDWRRRYAEWGALKKLEYVDRIAREVGNREPLHGRGQTDITVEEMDETVEEFYRERDVDESEFVANLALDTDLTDIFVDPRRKIDGHEYRPASQLVHEQRRDLVDKVHYWTGVRRTLVRTLVDTIERRLEELGLLADVRVSRAPLVGITAYITTLSMTFLTGQRRLRLRKPKK